MEQNCLVTDNTSMLWEDFFPRADLLEHRRVQESEKGFLKVGHERTRVLKGSFMRQ